MTPINIETEKQRFNAHLALTDNANILFSGIFGIGKTYFIKKFFEETAEYEAIILSPVNYSVSRNEDIFELIKYDVLFELMGKENLEIDNTVFSDSLTFSCFAKEEAVQIIPSLVEFVPKVGKPIKKIVSALEKLKKLYDEYEEKANCNEEKQIESFLQSIINQKGHAFEENAITQLTTILVNRLKTDKKQTVLVIDDLDRIDPEHIFRLFNIFACHIDTHKFGFDKILFVCDVENIRNIFHSKYGTNVDFTGYIDKFFSREIFHFDNKKEVISRIWPVFAKIGGRVNETNGIYFDRYKDDLWYIISCLFFSNAFNLRILERVEKKTISFREYVLYKSEGNSCYSNENVISVIYELLLAIYETHSSLDTALEKCEAYCPQIEINDKNNRFGNIVYLLDIENHNFKDGTYVCDIIDKNIKIDYSLSSKQIKNLRFNLAPPSKALILQAHISYFTLLREVFDKISQYRTLNLR